jgi:hypothetical protein
MNWKEKLQQWVKENSIVESPNNLYFFEWDNLEDMTKLSLNNFENLTSIPPEISNLTNLQELNLSRNKIKAIPPEISNLTNLKYLRLSNNEIEIIPPEISNLTNLQELRLSYNKIKVIPPEISNLTNLQELHLSNNKIKAIPPEVEKLENLLTLDTDRNLLPKKEGLPTLKELHGIVGPEALKDLTDEEVLKIFEGVETVWDFEPTEEERGWSYFGKFKNKAEYLREGYRPDSFNIDLFKLLWLRDRYDEADIYFKRIKKEGARQNALTVTIPFDIF